MRAISNVHSGRRFPTPGVEEQNLGKGYFTRSVAQSRRHGEALVGLAPQTKLQAHPKLKNETL